MTKIYYTILSAFLLVGCNQSISQTEKDYIKNLEEKNSALEKELQALKSEAESHKQASKNSNAYFTIGSTVDEVLEAMGEPTAYLKTAPEAKKFIYGISTVYFYQGKVISYDNLDQNLKVKVAK
jgi:flagellar biosynthesis component FlhA